MKLLIQAGNKGNSVVDHLIRPLASVDAVDRVFIVASRQGPDIQKVSYHIPPRVIGRSSPAAVLWELLLLLRLSKSIRPHCIVGHKLFPHALIAFLAAKVTGRPLVISLIAGPVELHSLANRIGVDIKSPLSFKGKMLMRILAESEAVVTTGSVTKDFLVRNGLKEDRVFAIIHTPESSEYGPAGTDKDYDVISVGRLAAVKHTEVILHAIAVMKKRRNDIRACIVGDGPRRDELIRLSSELGLENNVEFVGFQKDVRSYYNKAKVFVLASEREGFPNVLLEAMMCGLPSVISNCGDVTDIAVDEYNSIVIPAYQDVNGFADAIERLLDNPALWSRLSENALKTMSDIPMESVTRKWQEILMTTL